ncbi:hypothetical protein Tsubulata_021068 [Turnera subulata]|uniref:Reverse transcriptase zinc-binding domain-containing protein n=1 Tax=Turnera subulata TaxID=218843 RepID=A0A9Q0FK77_9ROSI|nr:hypothetical protein Tsubulata_021068 [Turnera subulata]
MIRNILPMAKSLCPFCREFIESRDHVLLHCKLTWSLWSRICRWWGVVWCIPARLEECFCLWPELASSSTARSSWLIIFYATVWSVWSARNRLIQVERHRLPPWLEIMFAHLKDAFPWLVYSVMRILTHLCLRIIPKSFEGGSWVPPRFVSWNPRLDKT